MYTLLLYIIDSEKNFIANIKLKKKTAMTYIHFENISKPVDYKKKKNILSFPNNEPLVKHECLNSDMLEDVSSFEVHSPPACTH